MNINITKTKEVSCCKKWCVYYTNTPLVAVTTDEGKVVAIFKEPEMALRWIEDLGHCKEE